MRIKSRIKKKELAVSAVFTILWMASALDGYLHWDKYLSIEGYRLAAVLFLCFAIHWLAKAIILEEEY